MIAKKKKPHNIGETLIKLCILKAAGFVSRETYSKKMAKISLSDFTIKTPIDELNKKTICVKFSKNYKLTFFQFNPMKQLILPNCCNC